MINISKEQKAGIVSGIVASAIFIYFIQPILNFSAFVFIRGSNIIGSAYTNRIYQQVAHLETQDYSFIIYVILLGIPAAAMLGIATAILTRSFKKRKNKDEKYGQEKEEIKKLPSLSVRLFVALFLFVFSMFIFSLVVANFVQLSTISSFKRHIRIVAPYISDLEEKKLISEWSLINSKGDYQMIYLKLNEIAKNNGLELPKNKIYSILSL